MFSHWLFKKGNDFEDNGLSTSTLVIECNLNTGKVGREREERETERGRERERERESLYNHICRES